MMREILLVDDHPRRRISNFLIAALTKGFKNTSTVLWQFIKPTYKTDTEHLSPEEFSHRDLKSMLEMLFLKFVTYD